MTLTQRNDCSPGPWCASVLLFGVKNGSSTTVTTVAITFQCLNHWPIYAQVHQGEWCLSFQKRWSTQAHDFKMMLNRRRCDRATSFWSNLPARLEPFSKKNLLLKEPVSQGQGEFRVMFRGIFVYRFQCPKSPTTMRQELRIVPMSVLACWSLHSFMTLRYIAAESVVVDN